MISLRFLKNQLNFQNLLVFVFVTLLAARFLFLDFGLPYVQQADEIELVEYPLNYAVNIKKVLSFDYEYFKPFSFVYGTLPTYLNTLLLIPFLKITSLFEFSQDRYYIYLYLRIIYAIFSIISCLGVYLVAKEITKDKTISLLAGILFSLNFYFLWLSKYLNNDILIVLFTIYFIYFYLKFSETLDIKFLYYSMLFVGFGISTKVTFVIILLFPIFDLIIKKRIKELIISGMIIFLVYLITNPYTFIYPIEFVNRVLEMRNKENGIVIDSYNTSSFKYFISLLSNLGILIAVFGFYKIFLDLKDRVFDITSATVLVFFVFFSFSSRLVDRWVLPIYFLLIINFLIIIFCYKQKYFTKLVIALVLLFSFLNFYQVNLELSKDANMKNAFLEFKSQNLESGKSIYLVTEKGLNPFLELGKKGMIYFQAPVILYESEGAFTSFPDNPENYDYIVFSSKVRSYYLNPFIYQINPEYTNNWEIFFKELNNPQKFELIRFYGSEYSSVINQENILIYKKK